MEFATPLIPARLVRRYQRFLADVVLDDGRPATAHCPNPGSMMGLKAEGLPCWLTDHGTKTKRKLRYTLEMVRLDDLPERPMVAINTNNPNRIAAEAVAAGTIPELSGYEEQRREVRYGQNSRIDLLLSGPGRPPCYVEVKNVHLRRPDGPAPTAAEFPDSVTSRGAKHLRELADRVAAGERAVMLYIVQRADCDHFRIAGDIDPAYDAGLNAALAAGVEALCYACTVDLDGVRVARPLPLRVGRAAAPDGAAAP